MYTLGIINKFNDESYKHKNVNISDINFRA